MKKKIFKTRASKLIITGAVLVLFAFSSCSKHYLCPAYGDNSKITEDENAIIHASLEYDANSPIYTNKNILEADTGAIPTYQ